MRRIKIGILANELFDTEVGRMGGFGWAVRQVSECFCNDPSLGIDTLLLMGECVTSITAPPREIHGSPVIWRSGSSWSWMRQLRRHDIDLLLSIDFRPSYQFVYASLPRTPVLLWVRDPWDDRDRAVIATLRVPGHESVAPQGVFPPRTQGLARIWRLSRVLGRPFLFAVTTPALAPKIESTYGARPRRVFILPNIVEPHVGPVRKAARPIVAFLARLDPVKRPWLLITVAERMPDVEFVVMGQSHFTGAGSWRPEAPPPNVRFIGHADEATKRSVLESAWILLNTSIHEGLSVSFLEALAHETPIVSGVNPEEVVSRFGEWVGRFPGEGTDGLDAFEAALRRLIADAPRRSRLGREGRAWVETTHSRSEFLLAFTKLCAEADVTGRRPK